MPKVFIKIPRGHLFRGIGFLAAVLSISAIAVYSTAVFASRFSGFDDAYVFIRYARHLLEGHGICWNIGGPQVQGVSSLPYLFQITALLKILPFSQNAVLVLTSSLNGFLSAGLIALACYQSLQTQRLKKGLLLPAAVIYFLLTDRNFQFHAGTGMDTMLAIAVNAVLILSVLHLQRNPSVQRTVLVGVCSWLSAACRIDNAVYALLFPLLVIVLQIKQGRRLLPAWAAVFGGLMLLDAVIRIRIFGEFMPLAFYVKRSGYYAGSMGALMGNPVRHLNSFLQTCLPFLALAVFCFSRNSLRRVPCYYLPVILTAIGFFQGFQIMGTSGRFFFPALPFVVVGAMLMLDGIFREAEQPFAIPARRFAVRGAVVLLFLHFSPQLFQHADRLATKYYIDQSQGQFDRKVVNFFQKSSLRYVEWMASIMHMDHILKKIPETITFAASEDGYLASRYPNMTFLDLNGLHDLSMARNGFSAEAVLSHEPDVIWMPHWAYPESTKSFWEQPAFWEDYEYYPRLFTYGLAIRKKSAFYEKIHHALSEVVVGVYPGLELAREEFVIPAGQFPETAASIIDQFKDHFGIATDDF